MCSGISQLQISLLVTTTPQCKFGPSSLPLATLHCIVTRGTWTVVLALHCTCGWQETFQLTVSPSQQKFCTLHTAHYITLRCSASCQGAPSTSGGAILQYNRLAAASSLSPRYQNGRWQKSTTWNFYFVTIFIFRFPWSILYGDKSSTANFDHQR